MGKKSRKKRFNKEFFSKDDPELAELPPEYVERLKNCAWEINNCSESDNYEEIEYYKGVLSDRL